MGTEELQVCYCPVPTPCAEHDQPQHRTSKPLDKLQLPILRWARSHPGLVHPCYLERIEQSPAHRKCQITPWATQATVTPPAVQRALLQMG